MLQEKYLDKNRTKALSKYKVQIFGLKLGEHYAPHN